MDELIEAELLINMDFMFDASSNFLINIYIVKKYISKEKVRN